jgi:diguanylate cyclase (GGDEF)-like protein
MAYRTIGLVPLTRAAAELMRRAQDGRVDEALVLAGRVPELAVGASPSEQAGLWYAVAVTNLIARRFTDALTAADRCVNAAVEGADPGWSSNGLSLRAMAQARIGRVEPALLDLARAEADLLDSDDVALRCWAHTGLGYGYLELRLYELAQPHLERAQELDASPIPLPTAPVIDLINLCELHGRWADELERVLPYEGSDDDVAMHRKEAHAYAERALLRAREVGDASYVAACRALELCSRPRGEPDASIEELRSAITGHAGPDHQGTRAVLGGALARALWAVGERAEALAVAREAVAQSADATDWQVGADAQWLLVELEAVSGAPGAAAGRSYARLLSRVLWQQRLSTLQGARAALSVERLSRDKLIAQRAASEDPLTGLGNRRALDGALRAAAAGSDVPVSLLVVDLDDFKAINDSFGHVVGDEVLRAAAAVVRGVARADDVVVRLGGDEFVVLARGADEQAGARLAARVRNAVDALEVGTSTGTIRLRASVGVATADRDGVARLLAEADPEMDAEKASRVRPRRPPG